MMPENNINGNGNGHVAGAPASAGLEDHLPPHNLAAERELLGGLMLDSRDLDEVLEMLTPDDFYRGAHEVLFRAIAAVHRRGDPVGGVSVAEELTRRGQFAAIGGDDYLIEIAMAAPHAANVLYNASVVREKSLARRWAQAGTESVRDAYSGQFTAAQVIARGMDRFIAITSEAEEEEEVRLMPRPEYPAEPAWRGVAGDLIMRMKDKTEAHPAALLVQFLIMFGNMIGHRVHAMVNRTQHFTNLYGCIVGPSSVARKGTGCDLIEWVLGHVDPDWAAGRRFNGIASGEGLIEKVRDEYCDLQGKLFTGEPDKRAMWIESEFESVLAVSARDHSVVSPKIRQLWDRCEAASASKNNPSKTTNAHVSIIGHGTEIALDEKLKTIEAANGFGNRFLWCFSERTQLLPDGATFTREEFAGEIDHLAYTAARVGGLSGHPFVRDDQARALWYSRYEELSSPPPGVYGAMVSRAAPQVLRLSLIYAVLDDSAIVRRSHLESALAVWDYCRQSAAYLFAETMGDPNAEKVLAYLTEAGPRTRTQINRAVFWGHCGPAKLVKVLDRMRRQGLIEEAEGASKTASSRSRSSKVWRLREPNLDLRLRALRAESEKTQSTPDVKPF